MKLILLIPSCDLWFISPDQGETYGFIKGAPPKQTKLLKEGLGWPEEPPNWWYILINGGRYATWTWSGQDGPRSAFYGVRVATYKVTNVKLKSKRQV